MTVSLTDYFDSNIGRLGDGQENKRGLVKSDIRLTPALDVDLLRRIGQHQVGLQASVGYDFYVRNTELNSERFLVAPSAYLNLPVCDVSASGQVARRQSDLGELIFQGIDPTLDTKNIQTTEAVRGQLICGGARGLRPIFEVGHSTGRNSNPVRFGSNYKTTYYQPSLAFATPALGQLSVFARKTDTDLPDQRSLPGAATGYELHGYGVGYERAIGRNLNFRGSFSRVSVTPKGGTEGRRSGTNFDTAVTLQLGEQLQLTGVASRQFTSALTSDAAYELDQNYGLTANYAVNRQLRFRFGGDISPRRLFYSNVQTLPRITEQTLRSAFAGASYDFGRRMRLNVQGGYTERTTDIPIFNYKAFNTLVGLAIDF